MVCRDPTQPRFIPVDVLFKLKSGPGNEDDYSACPISGGVLVSHINWSQNTTILRRRNIIDDMTRRLEMLYQELEKG